MAHTSKLTAHPMQPGTTRWSNSFFLRANNFAGIPPDAKISATDYQKFHPVHHEM
jgi:hypothetical protein